MMLSTHENCLRMRFCLASDCGALFFVHKHCDRGQRYCSVRCRQESRRQQRRAANSRYQRTEPGRFAHLRRQRIYRQKCFRPSVTDQGCHIPAPPAPKCNPVPHRCIVCQQVSRWIDPFDDISPRKWRQLIRLWVGTSPEKYVS